MIQAFSSNLSIQSNSPIQFNNVVIDKGCAEKVTAPATIELEQRGVYLVKVNGFGTGAAAGTETIQLYVNGVPQPQGQDQFTTASANISNFGFNCFVQVSQNNCSCNCYSAPTVLQVWAGDQELTDGYINIIVTKIC